MTNTDIQIGDLDEASLGPAMKRCTLMQRRFVMANLILGGRNMRRAAMMAGYSGNEATLAVTGYRTAHIQYVQDAIREEAQKRMTAASIEAVSTVMDIAAGNTAAPPSVRLAASLALMDRSGLHAKTEHSVTVTQDVGKNTVMLEMVRARLKADPANVAWIPEPIRLMLAAAEPIDAVYTEIDKADPGVLDVSPTHSDVPVSDVRDVEFAEIDKADPGVLDVDDLSDLVGD
jgi:phage terminase small subunit